MSACQPLHDYFENLGCDPQQVMSILDDDFLKDYVTDPQSRAADAVILKQQVPKLIQSLSSEEFFQCYSASIRIIIEKWLARYSPNTTRNYFLSKLDINVSASQPLAHIRSNSLGGVKLMTTDPTEPIVFPRCIYAFNLLVRHVGTGAFYAPETEFFSTVRSKATKVFIPNLRTAISLDFPKATILSE